MSVIKQLIQLQADSHALFVKFHNYHWNVKGLQFHAIHLFTEKAYTDMGVCFDDVAERALQLKAKVLVTPKALAEQTKVHAIEKECFSAKEVLENITKDYIYMKDEFEKLNSLAEKEGDTTSAMFAQDHIAAIEKELWMLDNSMTETCKI